MNNSALYKEEGKYAKLEICPYCGKKVHTKDDDINLENWTFGTGEHGGKFVHTKCQGHYEDGTPY